MAPSIADQLLHEYEYSCSTTRHLLEEKLSDLKLSDVLEIDLTGDNNIDMLVLFGHFLVNHKKFDLMYENCCEKELTFLSYGDKLKTCSFLTKWTQKNW